MTLDPRLKPAARRLAEAGIEDALRDARLLLREVPERFEAAVDRRAQREPFAYIVGRREFWSLDFEVTPDVLIPRPDTETVVEAAVARLRGEPPAHILDLGTGSGCILIALLSEFSGSRGTGVDLSGGAVAVATRNAARLGVDRRCSMIQAPFDGAPPGPFDLVVSNPPYIAESVISQLAPEVRDHEPRLALAGGPDGLSAIRAVASAIVPRLRPGGLALIEIGFDQGESAAVTLRHEGLQVLNIIKDLGGNDRVIAATRTI